jgi:hypothetical protein
MIPTLRNQQDIIFYGINQSMSIIDATRPEARKLMF